MKNLKNILAGGIVGIVAGLSTYCVLNLLTKSKSLTESIDRVYLMEKKDFPKDLPKNTAAYTFYDKETKKISVVLQKNYNKKTFFHEAGHAKHFKLDFDNSAFSSEWEKIANFEYGTVGGLINKALGRESGMLCDYSFESVYEDVADFVGTLGYDKNPEDIKKYFTKENLDYIKFSFPLYFADTTDHRYKQKIDLLKEYDFLTKEEHEKLSKNLGSLNYLLKK